MGNEEIIIYQVQNIDFIFSNYLNFPKAERTYLMNYLKNIKIIYMVLVFNQKI